MPGKRYCAGHQSEDEIRAAERETLRNERRRVDEPWRALYDTPEWKACARSCRRRDGFKCRECGRPGSSVTPLTVHHLTLVRTLWVRAQQDWQTFLIMATNPDICLTLCPSCHKTADNKLRGEEGTLLPKYARPRTPASQRRRRR
jgi:5-methylcytosine-specific restriction endonuclease McrA